MYSKYTTPSSSSSHCAHHHLHLVIITLRWHLPCTLHRCRGDGGGCPGSRCCCPHCPPPHHPHPPCGAGWWWWGRRHCRAPRLAHAPCRHSHPRRHLIVMPVPLLVVPLIVVDMSPWHWPWTSHRRHHCVDAGRVVGSLSIVLSLLSCPLLLLSCPSLLLSCPSLLLLSPSPSSSLSRHCPPRLPPVMVVHDR